VDMGVILADSRIKEMEAAGLWNDELLTDFVDRVATRDPKRTAITSYDGESNTTTTVSYGELDRLSRRWALTLTDLGVGPGDVMSLQLPNWWQFVVMHVAAVRIGAITNALMPIFRERELEFMLGFAGSKVLIAATEFRGFDYRPMIAGLRDDLPALRHVFHIGDDRGRSFEAAFMAGNREDAAEADQVFARLRPSANDVTELNYTSGTTGQPKGVMHTTNTTFGHLRQWNDHHGLDADSVVFMASPLAHRTGFIYGLLMPLILGGQTVLMDRWDPPRAAEAIEHHRATFTMAATPFLNDIVNMPNVERFDLSSLKTFVTAGAPIPPALVQRADEHFPFKVLSGWGMTEIACPCICDPADPPEKVWSSDGKCLALSEVAIHDDDDQPLPTGTEGRLVVRGACLFVGYLKRPDMYAQHPDGWFDTGDLARMDRDGYIRITGRAKDIIIRGGENVPVAEVESMLFRHPAIEDVAVVGAPDERLGERGCAYVTVHEGQTFAIEDMRRHLEETGTAKQYWPEFLVVLEEFPRTPSGKIQKFKLRERAAGDSGAIA